MPGISRWEELQPSGGTEQIRPGRAFAKAKGVTPYRYLMAVRISEARRLLERGVSSAEAAVETGFSDQSHFTNYFTAFTGLTRGPAGSCSGRNGREDDTAVETESCTGPPGGPADHCDLGDHLHLHQGLLVDFQPVEILFIRFMMGFLALLAVCPRRLQGVTRRQEGLFALAGLCGVCLYYLLENIALTYTMASNVGVIISVSPCFTALLTHFF